MSRFKALEMIRADHWDADEACWLKQQLSFSATHSVSLHVDGARNANTDTAEGIVEATDHMVKALLILIDHWTLRTSEMPYQEGVERPKVDLTAEALSDQPLEDIRFIFRAAMDLLRGPETAQTADAAAVEVEPVAAEA